MTIAPNMSRRKKATSIISRLKVLISAAEVMARTPVHHVQAKARYPAAHVRLGSALFSRLVERETATPGWKWLPFVLFASELRSAFVGSVTRVRLVPILMLLAVMSRPVCFGQISSRSYLLAGRATCEEAENTTVVGVGEILPFLVAVTPRRVLAGWEVEGGEVFFYVTDASLRPISFETKSARGTSMLHPNERVLTVVVEQRNMLENDTSSRVAAAQKAVFRRFSFAMFFSSAFHGIDVADVDSLLSDSPARDTSRHLCGELSADVVNESGLREIQFMQARDDVFTVRQPDLKLHEVNFAPFASGLQRVLYKCTYDPPLRLESDLLWTSECVTEEEGVNGTTVRVRYTVSIDEFTTDDSRVNSEINKIVSLVPDGERVVVDGPIEHSWIDGRIQRRIDSDALKRAEGLTFSRIGGISRLLVLLNFFVIGLILTYFVIRRVRKSP